MHTNELDYKSIKINKRIHQRHSAKFPCSQITDMLPLFRRARIWFPACTINEYDQYHPHT